MSHCDPAALATLVGGSVDESAPKSHPRVLTDWGTIRLGLRAWYVTAVGYIPPPLAPWNATAEEVAAEFRARNAVVAA